MLYSTSSLSAITKNPHMVRKVTTFPARTNEQAPHWITGSVVGDRAKTMGSPNADMTSPAVKKYANSLQGLLPPESSDSLRAIRLGIGANI